MKQCPRCKQTYSDDSLNFCLNDGELLTQFGQEPPSPRFDDSPPTMVLDQSRATNPTNWPGASPAQQWQPQNLQNRPFAAVGGPPVSLDKTLPTISMILGIISLALICCYGGIWLGLPAAALGFWGMRNADSDPQRYAGRGMAIAGMVMGVISLVASVLFILFAIVANAS